MLCATHGTPRFSPHADSGRAAAGSSQRTVGVALERGNLSQADFAASGVFASSASGVATSRHRSLRACVSGHGQDTDADNSGYAAGRATWAHASAAQARCGTVWLWDSNGRAHLLVYALDYAVVHARSHVYFAVHIPSY